MTERVRLTLTAMTQGGEALGRDATGRVVFVPYAIAGEEIVAEITQTKKGYARARLVEILQPSPARVAARCPHFGSPGDHPGSPLPKAQQEQERPAERQVGATPSPEEDHTVGATPSPEQDHAVEATPSPEEDHTVEATPSPEQDHTVGATLGGRPDLPDAGEIRRGCGGCQWQHISYDAQLKFKAEIVREQLARLGKLADVPVHETIGMTVPWEYRNHVEFQMDAAGRLCFLALESHDRIPIRRCFIQHPLVYELFQATELEGADYAQVTLRAGTRTGQKMLILHGHDEEPPEITVDEPVSIAYVTPDGDTLSLIGRDAIHEELRGFTFRISPDSFFQVNTAMAETLVAQVDRYLAPQATDTLLDAFGGVGTFGLLLASKVARVIEVEAGPGAVEDARANAVELTNVTFHRGLVEEVLPPLKTRIDLVVADPPRAGIDRRALDAIVAQAPRTIVYVSCDPATLARDARRLVDGGYRLTEVQPVDLFPQTYHIECVAKFVR